MNVTLLRTQISLEEDVVLARQRAREVARMLGYDHQEQTRLATAVSELARNAYQYAKGGMVEFCLRLAGEANLFVVRVLDRGPGIPNLAEILSGAYVSQTGMGVGLRGAQRLVDGFSVDAREGGGTAITLEKNLPVTFVGSPSRVQELSANLGRLERVRTYDEVALQNRELVSALEELNHKQRELNQINQELEDTNRGVVALYAELDQRAEDLRRANQVKTRFLSNITHEFRSPLNAVRNLTGLLLERVDGPLTSEQETQVRLIRKSVEGLSAMVDDLLDLAKVEAGKVPVRPVEFSLRDVFSSLRGLFRVVDGGGVELLIEDPADDVPFHTDEGKVTQVLRNFVSNALKYTERGLVHLTARRRGEDWAEISVRDTGIGIPPGSLDAVFEEFVQVESRLQGKVKGTGLGLPLSRRLAELLGGRIELESRVGEGSTFTLVLPLRYEGPAEGVYVSHQANAPAVVMAAPVAPPAPSADRRVLLVDDQDHERYVVRSVLASQFDCVIEEASSAGDGLRRVLERRPDLLVVDLVMPDFTGFTLIERLRAEPRLKDLPVVVFSGKELSAAEADFLRREASAVFSKTDTDEEDLIRGLGAVAERAGLPRKQKI